MQTCENRAVEVFDLTILNGKSPDRLVGIVKMNFKWQTDRGKVSGEASNVEGRLEARFRANTWIRLNRLRAKWYLARS